MSRATDILKRLQKTINEGPYATTRTTPNLAGDRDDYEGNQDQFKDFPYIEDPNEYQTYKAMEQEETEESDLLEQEPGGVEVAPGGTATPAVAGAGTDIEGGEMGAEMPGGEMGDMGMGMEDPNEQKLTSSEIGKVFELKKIYARLISIESHLSSTTDTSLLQMRGIVAQAMELFETVIANFEQYKEQINEIIVTFYKFLDLTYGLLQSFYKNDAKNEY